MSTGNTVVYFERGTPRSVTVNREGHITPDVVRVYERGQCHALALALHKLTGWQLIGTYKPRELRYRKLVTPNHVMVQSPVGYLDIGGVDALNRWKYHWPEVKPVKVTKKEVESFENIDYLSPNVEAAMPFAKKLIERHAPEYLQSASKEVQWYQTTLQF